MIKKYSSHSQAIYYELNGERSKALNSYANILKENPEDKKAKISIRRLSGIYAKFSDINKDRLEHFNTIKNEQEHLEFEKWLLKI